MGADCSAELLLSLELCSPYTATAAASLTALGVRAIKSAHQKRCRTCCRGASTGSRKSGLKHVTLMPPAAVAGQQGMMIPLLS